MQSTELKKLVENLDKKELTELLREMVNLRESNAVWLKTKLCGGEALPLALEFYKKMIRDAFGKKVRFNLARKAINDFKKASDNPEALLDLMIFYVECGTDYTLEYGDLWESFYTSLESMYLAAIKVLTNKKNKYLIEKFKPRLEKLVSESEDMGWGYHDTLSDYYEIYLVEGQSMEAPE